VLEAHEAPKTVAPQTCCGRAIAEYLIAEGQARRIGKRLIQMVRAKAREAIQQAKAARDAMAGMVEQLRTFSYFDGPIGVGNLLPFARLKNYGDKLHYELPPAGYHYWHNRFDRKQTSVSSRSLFTRQILPGAISA